MGVNSCNRFVNYGSQLVAHSLSYVLIAYTFKSITSGNFNFYEDRMQELERALDLAMPERVANVDPQARDAALKYLDALRESSEGWKLAVMKLFQTKQEYVQFYCFHVVQNLFSRGGYVSVVSVFSWVLRSVL